MISFYPGPSRLDPGIPAYLGEAATSGILSVNHRSKDFVSLSQDTVIQLRLKLAIPDTYSVFFVSSATECWEIIAQSLISEGSIHLHNGAFGEKWHEYTAKLAKSTVSVPFVFDDKAPLDFIPKSSSGKVICITHNETSNGTQLDTATLKWLRELHPEALIAVDATSSMAGSALPFSSADLWFASVQKCFGLPAGMAVMVCSEKAINKATDIDERNHYNSLVSIIEKMENFQTTHTPNVLAIFLLNKVMHARKRIDEIDLFTKRRAAELYAFIGQFTKAGPLVENAEVRSDTVIAVEAEPEIIAKVKSNALTEGILLGNGYGEWAHSTFRIANFPSIQDNEFEKLKDFLRRELV